MQRDSCCVNLSLPGLFIQVIGVPVTFFEDSKSGIFANLIYHSRKLLALARIELGSPLDTILRSERSNTKLAGPAQWIILDIFVECQMFQWI